jgi:hypothetical protein
MSSIACYFSVTMPTQRVYKTNLAFEPTLTSLTEKYSTPGASKGHATFYLPMVPKKIPIQITTNGFVLILGGKMENDENILRIIGVDVTTPDSQQFNWTFHKQTKGEKELLEDLDLDAQRRLLRYLLDKLSDALKELGTWSGSSEVDGARELVTTLPSKIDTMDAESISEHVSEIQSLVDAINGLLIDMESGFYDYI